MNNSDKRTEMKTKSREFAMSRSWDAVFESVYAAYDEAYAIHLRDKETDLLNKGK
jgi:hypothetical protein